MPRSTHSHHQVHSSVYADPFFRCVLARRSKQRWPAAHLRHRLGIQGILEAYQMMMEEAEKRDHRRLGAELDLFSFPDDLGSGLPVFHPNGGIVRTEMEEHSRRRHIEAGYSFVNTPHITKQDL